MKIEGACAAYGRLQVLWDVSLSLHQGESILVLGANGAGKTTLLKALLGLVPLTAGTVTFEGERIDSMRTDQRVRRGIAYMTELGIFPTMTVEENLMLGGWRLGRAKSRKALGPMYEAFPDLAERRRTAAGSLSGGQRKMVGVAKTLMSAPKLLVMDEPSSGLSPLFVKEVIAQLAKVHSEGMSLLVAEQNVAFLEATERAYVIEGGRVRFDGTVADFEGNDALRDAFFGLDH